MTARQYSELKSSIEQFRSEVRSEFAQFRSDVGSEFQEVRSELAQLRSEFEEFRSDVRAEFATVHERIVEVRLHMDIIGESLRSEIRLLAENQQAMLEVCMRSDDRLAARIEQVDSILRDSVRLSYRDLDQRLTAVELRVQ